MKRKILLIFTVVLIVSLISVSSLAYFVTEGKATSQISSGGVSVVLHTKGSDGSEQAFDGVSITPGDTVKETLTVENDGDHPVWVRVSVAAVADDGNLPGDGCLSFDLNTTDWTEQSGWYYYNRQLKGGETTEPLFTEVTFDLQAIDNRYLGKAIKLDVDIAAVQAENNGSTALDASGWPA